MLIVVESLSLLPVKHELSTRCGRLIATSGRTVGIYVVLSFLAATLSNPSPMWGITRGRIIKCGELASAN